jgi:hypothetical protein
MWLIFGSPTGEKYVIELSGSDTVEELRGVLHTRFDQPLDVVIACGSYSFSNPETRLDEIPGLKDMTEVTLEIAGSYHRRARGSQPNPYASTFSEPRPRRKTTSDVVDLIPETICVLPPIRPLSPAAGHAGMPIRPPSSGRKGAPSPRQSTAAAEPNIIKPQRKDAPPARGGAIVKVRAGKR